MKLKVGDNVLYTRKERILKKGMKKSDYIEEAMNKEWCNADDIIDKYFTKKFKTEVITTKIVNIRKNYLGKDDDYCELESEHFCRMSSLEYIPYNAIFAKFLNEATRMQSPLTKTGQLLVFNNVVILEFMTSSKNVWVDKTIGDKFTDEEKQMIDK